MLETRKTCIIKLKARVTKNNSLILLEESYDFKNEKIYLVFLQNHMRLDLSFLLLMPSHTVLLNWTNIQVKIKFRCFNLTKISLCQLHCWLHKFSNLMSKVCCMTSILIVLQTPNLMNLSHVSNPPKTGFNWVPA